MTTLITLILGLLKGRGFFESISNPILFHRKRFEFPHLLLEFRQFFPLLLRFYAAQKQTDAIFPNSNGKNETTQRGVRNSSIWEQSPIFSPKRVRISQHQTRIIFMSAQKFFELFSHDFWGNLLLIDFILVLCLNYIIKVKRWIDFIMKSGALIIYNLLFSEFGFLDISTSN